MALNYTRVLKCLKGALCSIPFMFMRGIENYTAGPVHLLADVSAVSSVDIVQVFYVLLRRLSQLALFACGIAWMGRNMGSPRA